MRVGGGVLVGAVELSALIDPQGMLDGQHTADVAIGTRAGEVALHAAWRNTSIRVADGQRYYESLVTGASLPVLRHRAFSMRAGIEVATLITAHGEMPVQWIAADNLRRSISADFFVAVTYGR